MSSTASTTDNNNGLTYQEVIDKQKKMMNRISKGNKCIASRIWACREPARNARQGVCDLHVNEVILVDWERCRLCEVSCFPYEMQSGSRSNAPLNHKNLKRDIPLVSYPYALDSLALFVFATADDAETAAEFIQREYPKPSQRRLHLIPLSYEDNVPLDSHWKNKQIPFYFDKRRKELLPAVILDKWSREGPSSPRSYLPVASRLGDGDEPNSNASPLRQNLPTNARQAFSTIDHQLSLLRKAFAKDLSISPDTDRLRAENKRLNTLLQQREGKILELQRFNAANHSGVLQVPEIVLDRREHSLSASPPRQVSNDMHHVRGGGGGGGGGGNGEASLSFGILNLKSEEKLNSSMDSDTDTNEEEKDPRVVLLPSYNVSQLSQRPKQMQSQVQNRHVSGAGGTIPSQHIATSAAALTQMHLRQQQQQHAAAAAAAAAASVSAAADVVGGAMSPNVATSSEVLFPSVPQTAASLGTSRVFHQPASSSDALLSRQFSRREVELVAGSMLPPHMANQTNAATAAAIALAYKNSKKRKLNVDQAAGGVVLRDPTVLTHNDFESSRNASRVARGAVPNEALAFDMDVTGTPTATSPFGVSIDMVDTSLIQREADWAWMQRNDMSRYQKANEVDIRVDDGSNPGTDCNHCNPWVPCPKSMVSSSRRTLLVDDEVTPTHNDCELEPSGDDLTARSPPEEQKTGNSHVEEHSDLVESVQDFLKDQDSHQRFRDYLQRCDANASPQGHDDGHIAPRAIFLDFYAEASNYGRSQDKSSAKKLGQLALDLVNMYMATENVADTMLFTQGFAMPEAVESARKRALARLCVWFSDFERSDEFSAEASSSTNGRDRKSLSKSLSKQSSSKNPLKRWSWVASRRGETRGNSVRGHGSRR